MPSDSSSDGCLWWNSPVHPSYCLLGGLLKKAEANPLSTMNRKHVTATVAVLSLLAAFAVVGAAQPATGQALDDDWFQDTFTHPVFQDDWSPFDIFEEPETVDGIDEIEETEETIDETDEFDDEFDGFDGVDDTVDDTDETDPSEEDIAAAQRASDEADACTMEFAEMQSPHDPDVTYDATDGCQIAELEDRGWERIGTDTGLDEFEGIDETDETDETDDETSDFDGIDETDETGDEFDDETGDDFDEIDGVTEEAYVEPAPEEGDPYFEAQGEGTDSWVSYINPRDEYRTPALGDGSGKFCVTLLNEEGDHIVGETIPNTQVTMATGDSLDWHTSADPFTVNFPLTDHYERPLDADQFGTSPTVPQGEGYMDSHCLEWHDLADDATLQYGPVEITGEHADNVEVVGYIQQDGQSWDTSVDPIADAESYEAAGGGWTYGDHTHGQMVAVLQLDR